MNKEETILYLRYLKSQNYIFSNFNLNHVLDFIDELQEERTNLLKQIDKREQKNNDLKQALNKIRNNVKTLGKFDGERCTRNFKMMSADFNYILQIIDEVLGGSDENKD